MSIPSPTKPTKKRFYDRTAYTITIHGETWSNTAGYFFITKIDGPDPNETYYGITSNFAQAEVVHTIDELAELFDQVQQHRIVYESNRKPITDFVLTPVVLNISVSDASMEVSTVAHTKKREAALAKLTDEEKELLGLTPKVKTKHFNDTPGLGDTSWDLP